MRALAEKDAWFIKLQARKAELEARAEPTAPQIQSLWNEVVKAYWKWISARLDKEEKHELIKVVEGQMRRRLIELRKRETLKLVGRIQRKLGYRFSPGMNAGGRPAAPQSPTKT